MKVSFSPTPWTGVFTNIPFFLQFSRLRHNPWNPGFPSCTSPQVCHRCRAPCRHSHKALKVFAHHIKKSQRRSKSLCRSKAVNSVFVHHLPLSPYSTHPHHVSPSSKPTPACLVSFGPMKYRATRSTIARHLRPTSNTCFATGNACPLVRCASIPMFPYLPCSLVLSRYACCADSADGSSHSLLCAHPPLR